MKLVAGIDIGNATTESSIGPHRGRSRGLSGQRNRPHHRASRGPARTSTASFHSLTNALEKAGLELKGAVGGAPE